MKVCKLDGASVGSVESMKDLVKLINDGTPKIVVLSATTDIAKHLDDISACLFNRDIDQAHDKITKLEFQFVDFANELLANESIKQKAIDYILERFHDVWNFTKKTGSSDKCVVDS